MTKDTAALLLKGNKGLFTYIDNKIYFPDRLWENPEEGLCKVILKTVDKGTYGFFKGVMLQTDMEFSYESFMEWLASKGLSLSSVRSFSELRLTETFTIYRLLLPDTAIFLFQEGGKFNEIYIPSVYTVDFLSAVRRRFLPISTDMMAQLLLPSLDSVDVLSDAAVYLLVALTDLSFSERKAFKGELIDRKFVVYDNIALFLFEDTPFSLPKDIIMNSLYKTESYSVESIDFNWLKVKAEETRITVRYPDEQDGGLALYKVDFDSESYNLPLFYASRDTFPLLKDASYLAKVEEGIIGLDRKRKFLAKVASKGGRVSKSVLEILKNSALPNYLYFCKE